MSEVQGQVTLDGRPVTDVVVRFLPQPKEGGAYAESKAAFGEVDSDGRYRLSTNGEYDGASVGTHRVTVNPLDPSKRPAGVLPANTLIKVEPGSNEIDLLLKAAARE